MSFTLVFASYVCGERPNYGPGDPQRHEPPICDPYHRNTTAIAEL